MGYLLAAYPPTQHPMPCPISLELSITRPYPPSTDLLQPEPLAPSALFASGPTGVSPEPVGPYIILAGVEQLVNLASGTPFVDPNSFGP